MWKNPNNIRFSELKIKIFFFWNSVFASWFSLNFEVQYRISMWEIRSALSKETRQNWNKLKDKTKTKETKAWNTDKRHMKIHPWNFLLFYLFCTLTTIQTMTGYFFSPLNPTSNKQWYLILNLYNLLINLRLICQFCD